MAKLGHRLCDFGVVPGGGGGSVIADDKAKPFKVIAVLSNHIKPLLRNLAFELGDGLFVVGVKAILSTRG